MVDQAPAKRHQVRRKNGPPLPQEGYDLIERALAGAPHLKVIETRERTPDAQFSICGMTIFSDRDPAKKWPAQLIVSWHRYPPSTEWLLAGATLYEEDVPLGTHVETDSQATNLIEEFFTTHG